MVHKQLLWISAQITNGCGQTPKHRNPKDVRRPWPQTAGIDIPRLLFQNPASVVKASVIDFPSIPAYSSVG